MTGNIKCYKSKLNRGKLYGTILFKMIKEHAYEFRIIMNVNDKGELAARLFSGSVL